MMIRRAIALLGGLLALTASGAEPVPPRRVEVAVKPGAPWIAHATRTLDDLPAAAVGRPDAVLSPYGGLASRRTNATGFFRVARRDGRWWLVDPEGCFFLSQGVSSVKPVPTPGAAAALQAAFGSETGWAEGTTAWLREHGFNSLGAWSDTEGLRAVARPLPYTRIWNFMSSYGRKRGGTFQQAGHLGYPNDCPFVFDPEFETFCEAHARPLVAGKDDPWLLGHFSDNELPFPREALRNYLDLPETDPGRRAALDWLRLRHGPQATEKDITPQDAADFQAVVVERYFRVVAQAIKRHDPNHLYLGARFYGADLRFPEVFRAAGPHVDVVSVNYYRAWTPARDRLEMWARESGRPVLITEWYAKGADAGLANTSGAGWLVKTQRDRGRFYEHFTLGLLESRVCVGWHWFKYVDNDPDDKKVDPSNRDSNKGLVSNRYVPYRPLLESMKRIQERAYGLADYFDRSPAARTP